MGVDERWDPFAADRERRESASRINAERLFPSLSQPGPEEPAKPAGSADGGEGTAGTERHTYEDTCYGRMRVFDPNEPFDRDEQENP